MGSSDRAGNKGVPATPRDGAAVELQGLAFAVLEYLDLLHSKGLFPHSGVSKGIYAFIDQGFTLAVKNEAYSKWKLTFEHASLHNS